MGGAANIKCQKSRPILSLGCKLKKVNFVFVCLLTFAVAGSLYRANAAPAGTLERGRYLVEQVGMCGDCHSPRNEKGELMREKLLQGTQLPFKPAVLMPVWADKTPNIAGLPGWNDKDAVKFLMTGLAYNDLPARPPMPQYRFNQDDATAIVAYLRSLVPVKETVRSRK